MAHKFPLSLHAGCVQPGWIDYNQHMNIAYYVVAFDGANDAFFRYVGIDEDYRVCGGFTTYALDLRLNYLRELKVNAQYTITTQLLDFDHKRLHFFHRMYHATDEYLAATHEQISMHIDVRGPKGAPMAERIIERLESLFEAHSKQPRPSQSVRPIGIRRK